MNRAINVYMCERDNNNFKRTTNRTLNSANANYNMCIFTECVRYLLAHTDSAIM